MARVTLNDASLEAPPSATPWRSDRRGSLPTWAIIGLRIGVFILVLLLWEWGVASGTLTSLVVPTPGETGARFLSDIESIITGGGMQQHFLTTVAEIYIAFTIVVFLGLGLGIVITESAVVNRVIYPYIVALAAMPRIAIAPLIVVWFGFEMESKVAIGVLIGIFPTLVATITGLSNTEDDKLRLMRALGATNFQTFRKVRFGDALPYIFAGLQTSVVVCALGVVVGEFISGRRGLGVLITVYNDSLDVSGVFSSLIILGLVGMANYYAMQYARRRIVFWIGDPKPR